MNLIVSKSDRREIQEEEDDDEDKRERVRWNERDSSAEGSIFFLFAKEPAAIMPSVLHQNDQCEQEERRRSRRTKEGKVMKVNESK